jgi:exonuclease III
MFKNNLLWYIIIVEFNNLTKRDFYLVNVYAPNSKTNRKNAGFSDEEREKNTGWRIDYFIVSKNFENELVDLFISPEVLESDHCPVGIVTKK